MTAKKPKAVAVSAPEEVTVTPESAFGPNFRLGLPFEDRMKGFDADYKALSAHWGIYHLPVTLYDDATVPGGRYGQQLNPEKTLEESK